MILNKVQKNFMNTLFYQFIFFLLLPFHVSSFNLSTHRAMTEYAFDDFLKCIYPKDPLIQEKLKLVESEIIKSNLQEDTDYLSNKLRYSHFYNPHFYIRSQIMYLFDRCPSNYRIMHISQILQAQKMNKKLTMEELYWDKNCSFNKSIYSIFFKDPSLSESVFNTIYQFPDQKIESINQHNLKLLGKAIHHIQDMASPAHVVPIMHPKALSISYKVLSFDAFEGFHKNAEILDSIKKRDHQDRCAFINHKAKNLMDILDQSAHETLRSLMNTVDVLIKNAENQDVLPSAITWQKWYDTLTPPDKFGFRDYGPYQNSFGQTEFKDVAGNIIQVDSKSYEYFARERLQQSIEHTKSALYYFWNLFEI